MHAEAIDTAARATSPAVPVVGLFGLLRLWAERSRSRRVLATLDDRMLSDIGLSRSDVFNETSKPFWRA